MTAANLRPLTICTLAHERAATPIHVGDVSWADALNILTAVHPPGQVWCHAGGYKLVGPRANDNVPFRSLIQLDIDTRSTKDKVTGRITEVTQQRLN
jgi:hypothetical protein